MITSVIYQRTHVVVLIRPSLSQLQVLNYKVNTMYKQTNITGNWGRGILVQWPSQWVLKVVQLHRIQSNLYYTGEAPLKLSSLCTCTCTCTCERVCARASVHVIFFGETGSCYAAQDDLELLAILLHEAPGSWDHRCVPPIPSQSFALLFTPRPRVSAQVPEAVLPGALHVECPAHSRCLRSSTSEDGANHMLTAHVCSRGNRTSAVSCPLIVIQTSRSLCLNPNPFLEEPNKLNLVPVRDR